MIEWFKNLSEGWQTAIFGAVVAVGLAVIGGLFAFFKWLFRKKDGPSPQNIKINTGIDPNNLVDLFGKTKEELGQANERIRHLEEQLAQRQVLVIPGQQQTPQPTQPMARRIARLTASTRSLSSGSSLPRITIAPSGKTSMASITTMDPLFSSRGRTLPTVTADLVKVTSSGLGVGSPLGWLCTRMIAFRLLFSLWTSSLRDMGRASIARYK